MKCGPVVLLFMALILHCAAAFGLEAGEAEDGKNVSLSKGEVLSLRLPGNPTTGYLWEVAAVDGDVLAVAGEPEFVPESGLTGAGGTFTFRFTAVKAGTAQLGLVYRRPWEKTEPLRQFRATVTVGEHGAAEAPTAVFVSDRGERLVATFGRDPDRVAVTLPDGRAVSLPAALSASGARYSNGKETFWEHQGVGTFLIGEIVMFEGREQGANDPPRPQPRFREFPEPDPFRVEPATAGPPGEGEVRALQGNYAYLYGPDSTILVRGKGPKAQRLSVTGFENRPLDARWINAKLLYLEVWFNPHNGAYWIYDVEKERVVSRELMNDGELRE